MEQQVYRLLEEMSIPYERVEHPAVYTVAQSQKLEKEIEGAGCKNLFLRDRERNYYLYVLPDGNRADLKALQTELACSKLSFASPEALLEQLGLTPGSVSPLGVIHNDGSVTVLLDSELEGKRLLVHPNVNTATISLAWEDLLRILTRFGNPCRVVFRK